MQVPSSSPVPAVFSFDSKEIRTIVVSGEPWFVANDVAAVLGYVDCKQAVRDHCKRSELLKGVESVPFTTSPRGITIIPEGDVFRLIVRSNLPAAEKFEAWVMDEVLPAIRKTGSYNVPALPTDPMAILKLTFEALEQSNQRLAVVETKIQELNDNIRLHQWQCHDLKLAVNTKAYDFHKKYGVEYKQLYPGIWNRVKLEMRVSSYPAIPATQFDRALDFVRQLSIKDMPDYVREQAFGFEGGAA